MLLQSNLSGNVRRGLAVIGVLLCMLSAVAADGIERVQVKVTVRVTDKNGKPAADATVQIDRKGEKNDKGHPVEEVISGQTDPNGQFSTTGDPKFFELKGKPHLFTVTIPGETEPLQLPISDDELRAAAKNGQLIISIPPESPKSTKIKLNGRVTSSDGKPVQGAEVALQKPDGSSITKTNTGRDGTYALQFENSSNDRALQVVVTAIDYQDQTKTIDLREPKPGEELSLAIDVTLSPVPSTLDALWEIVRYVWIPIVFAVAVVLGFVLRPPLERLKGTFQARDELKLAEQQLGKILTKVADLEQSTIKKHELKQELRVFADTVVNEVKNGLPSSTSGQGGYFERDDRHQNSNDGNDGYYGGSSPFHDYEAPKDGLEWAQSSYQKLIHKTLEITPIYLNVDGARSAAGKLQDSTVYLTQASSSMGPLVLFSDSNDGNRGWVYPNPKVAFRPAAVRDVFPNLSEADYESSKETVRPTNVRRDGDRWRVERG